MHLGYGWKTVDLPVDAHRETTRHVVIYGFLSGRSKHVGGSFAFGGRLLIPVPSGQWDAFGW